MRRGDRPKIIANFVLISGLVLFFTSINLVFLGMSSVYLLLLGLILILGANTFYRFYTKKNGEIVANAGNCLDYELELKRKLMPKFLNIFGDFEWFKVSTSPYGSTSFVSSFWEFLKKEVILPTNLFYDIDDVIEGFYKNVKIRIVEAKIGLSFKHLILLPFAILPAFMALVITLVLLIVLIVVLKIWCLLVLIPLVAYCLKKYVLIAGNFRGVIVELQLPKNFSGYSFLCEKGLSNRTVIFKKTSEYKPLRLEYIDFNKNFKAWTNNQVEARYVLTPTFIERFLNIRFAFKANYIRASFRKDKMVLMVSCKKDLFSMGNLNKETTKKTFDELFDEMYSVLMLVDELKLNQKIGL
jgi:hypothetical protein